MYSILKKTSKTYKKRFTLPLVLILMLFGSWGFLVHRTLHQIAIYSLPEPLQQFYFKNLKEIVKTSVDPDTRRKEDPSEETKHFIDLDSKLFKNKTIPENWGKAVKLFTEKKLRKAGTLPWEIVKTKEKLTQAFLKNDKKAILLYSSDLGHYLADACVPLHTSINYDGQLTDQVGMHSLWETECPAMFLEKYNLFQKPKAVYLKNINPIIWKTLRDSESLVANVLESEKKISVQFEKNEKYKYHIKDGIEEKKYSGKFIEAYNIEMQKQIESRMLKAAELISNFWYTAWVDAKSPSILTSNEFNEKDKLQLARELEAWKTNQLISKKLLRSKNGNEK